jgi:hypothetical protein
MGRIPKGVVTVGVTRAANQYAPAEAAWHLDPAVAPGGSLDCPAEGHDSPDLIHELLDHWIPGFALGGARAEAKALVQFAARTGGDPMPGLEGLADRLVLAAEQPADPLPDILPRDLLARLSRAEMTDALALRRRLQDELGEGLLRARLTGQLLELGWEGMAPARATWFGRGLDFRRRQALARALGRVLHWMEHSVQRAEQAPAHGELAVASDMVRFRFDPPGVWEWAREVGPP